VRHGGDGEGSDRVSTNRFRNLGGIDEEIQSRVEELWRPVIFFPPFLVWETRKGEGPEKQLIIKNPAFTGLPFSAKPELFLHVDQFHHAGSTDKDVDDPLNHRPSAEDQVHDVEVRTCKAADADESPVKGTDDNQNVYEHVHTGEGKDNKRYSTSGTYTRLMVVRSAQRQRYCAFLID
jgi:hypothetical protein